MYFSTIFTAALAFQLLSISFASPTAAPLPEDDLARHDEVVAELFSDSLLEDDHARRDEVYARLFGAPLPEDDLARRDEVYARFLSDWKDKVEEEFDEKVEDIDKLKDKVWNEIKDFDFPDIDPEDLSGLVDKLEKFQDKLPKEFTINGEKVTMADLKCGVAIAGFGLQFLGPFGAITKFPRIAGLVKNVVTLAKIFRKGLKEEAPPDQDVQKKLVRMALTFLGIQQVYDRCPFVKEFYQQNKDKFEGKIEKFD